MTKTKYVTRDDHSNYHILTMCYLNASDDVAQFVELVENCIPSLDHNHKTLAARWNEAHYCDITNERDSHEWHGSFSDWIVENYPERFHR